MEITYVGHSCFKLRGKKATVVTDPYLPKNVGFSLPTLSADIVTVSHGHGDHNAVDLVEGTARRKQPYCIRAPGEYEISGVGVFGWGSFHDAKSGSERGKNTIYSIHIDGVRVGHLGDLGHTLTEEQVENLGLIDVLLLPVGGGLHTLSLEDAIEVMSSIQPSYVVPMHYKTDKHDHPNFADLQPIERFLKEIGSQYKTLESLQVNPGSQLEETEVVVLTPRG